MAYHRGRFPDERLIGVEAKLVKMKDLEYKSNVSEVTPGCEQRPMLKESMVDQKNVSIDVMEGYNPSVDSAMNLHSIYHFYEFEHKTQFLDMIPRQRFKDFEEIRSRFLCCRYVICSIDDWMIKHISTELLAQRTNGDVYIGANKVMNRISPHPASKEAAYGGLNFANKVTMKEEEPNTDEHHCVVKQFHIRNRNSQKSMTLFISSVARAFDQSGNVVELKTIGENVRGRLQNLQGNKARNWWLRALLSGADRIVYGIKMDNHKINEIQEASIDDFTRGHFQFNENRLFAKVFGLFEKIDKTLVNEGSMCLVKLNRYEDMDVKLTTISSLSRSPFW